MRALPALALAAALVPAARADLPATCHCYRDRDFDPARPAAADPYILAAARSSLLSAAFGVAKTSLVRSAMGGTLPEDLWIAHWAGSRQGRSAESLLEARAEKGSWKAALAAGGGLAPGFEQALASGAPAAALAALAVDDVLVARLGADAAAVRALRAAGASSEETVIASLLAAHLVAPTLPLFLEVRAGRSSWGSVLRDSGFTPAGIDPLVRRLVQR